MGRYNKMKLRSKDLRYVEDPSNNVKTHNAPLSDTPLQEQEKSKIIEIPIIFNPKNK